MESRKKRDRLRIAAAAVLTVILFPITAAAVISAVPPAETVLFLAASASAALSAGDIFQFDNENIYGHNEENSEILPDELSGNTDIVYAEKPVFTVDDTDMLSFGAPGIPNSSDEERYVRDEDPDAGPRPYPESIEDHDGTITSVHYGTLKGDDYIDLDVAGQVRNVTDVPNEKLLAESRLAPDIRIEKNSDPQILIMHTHTTESYEPYERDFYDSSFISRTTDERMNMAAVGDAIAEQLEEAGISVIHDTTMHDYPSYNGSYDRSRETVQKILEEYPSIKIVLDIHRDAIERSDGERIAPVAEINGRNAAQVMIISGCDDGTMDMPDYMKNFRFACALQRQLESSYEGLTRPILFDYRKYNQDLTTGSILIEVGGHANSIDQAVYSGELIGRSLAELFT